MTLTPVWRALAPAGSPRHRKSDVRRQDLIIDHNGEQFGPCGCRVSRRQCQVPFPAKNSALIGVQCFATAAALTGFGPLGHNWISLLLLAHRFDSSVGFPRLWDMVVFPPDLQCVSFERCSGGPSLRPPSNWLSSGLSLRSGSLHPFPGPVPS